MESFRIRPARLVHRALGTDVLGVHLYGSAVLGGLPDRHRSVLPGARSICLGDEKEFWDGLMLQVRAFADHFVAQPDAQKRQL